ncbi:MAG: glutathione peroxidase [Bacillota bacterium]
MGFYEFEATRPDGERVSLENYKDKVVLVVNTATKCGFANQFEGLEQLYQDYKSEGFVVLGFPSNQFKNQEPDDSETVEQTCKLNFGVTFPIFEKVDVKGPDAHPLFKWLTRNKPGLLGSAIKWNFTKFLIDRDGKVVKRFGPARKPDAMRVAIAKTLT